jgi:hypothetical protein
MIIHYRIKMGVIAMTYLKPLLKLAVIASSLLLVAGSIAYRTGAFNEWVGRGSAAEGNPSEVTPPPSSPITPPSKAGIFIDPSEVSTPVEQQPRADKSQINAIMGGSKAPWRYIDFSGISKPSDSPNSSQFHFHPEPNTPNPLPSSP